MRKVVVTGVGSVVLCGLLVTQSWAASFKSNLYCSFPLATGGKVSIKANGDVKGSIKFSEPLTGTVQWFCEIYCGPTLGAGPVLCVDAELDGDTKVTINAPGLGASLPSPCIQPSVSVVDVCVSAYFPPGP